MDFFVVSLVLLSAFLHSLRNYVTKKSFNKMLFIWWYGVFAIILYLPFFIFFLWNNPNFKPGFFIFILASAVIHFFYWIFLSKAYETGDLSAAYPIMRSSPALVLLVAVVFLEEQVALTGFSGILLVSLGIYIVGLEGLSLKDFTKPLKSLFTDKATIYAFLTLLTVTSYSIVDKLGVGYLHSFNYLYIMHFSTFTLLTIYVSRKYGAKSLIREYEKNRREIILNAILVFASYSLTLYAYTFEKVSYIVGLRQVSVVFGVILGIAFLKEKHGNYRLAAAALITLGAYLITTAK